MGKPFKARCFRALPRRTRVAAPLLLLLCGAAVAGDWEPAASRRADLIRMVRQDCGSCHGMRLLGGLGPALTPAALADKPAESLELTILQGRLGTPMPPWGRFLSEQEAAWIVARLQAGFPEDRAFVGAGLPAMMHTGRAAPPAIAGKPAPTAEGRP
ncbi:MAG: cytochrome c [Betaproteobacteria bacterium]|nr:cytochrome c [Betaproteobacteria bacterium]